MSEDPLREEALNPPDAFSEESKSGWFLAMARAQHLIDTGAVSGPAREEPEHVWLTYYSSSPIDRGSPRNVCASVDRAKRLCEAQVVAWQDAYQWENEMETAVVLHAPTWELVPDPRLPAAFHRSVPKDRYVWVGHYCKEQPTWLFLIQREEVIPEENPDG